jgi:AraC family transcriptional regulator of adaptative response/methylated-DNA-[protein]-cysteine methyltransferase
MRSSSRLPDEFTMYAALLRRDASYEGVFWAAVRTTGIVCRPTCPGRKPLAQNVEYFPRLADALAAGYRPCERCRPQRPAGDPPEWLGRLETSLARHPTGRVRDAELRGLGLDPARVRRWFLRHHGLTFSGLPALSASRRRARAPPPRAGRDLRGLPERLRLVDRLS